MSQSVIWQNISAYFHEPEGVKIKPESETSRLL